GSSIMLVPVLVYAFGPKQAVPIMAVAAIMANLSRVAAWWREVDWRACAAYALPGILAAALGARTLLVLPARAVDIAIGVFLIAGSSLMGGAFIAKRFVLALMPDAFRLIMDGIMLLAGLSMLWNAAHAG